MTYKEWALRHAANALKQELDLPSANSIARTDGAEKALRDLITELLEKADGYTTDTHS